MFTALGRLTTLGAWFFLTPAVLAALGPEKFGFWSILLILGGTLPILYLSALGIRYLGKDISMEEPEGVLFTEVVTPN